MPLIILIIDSIVRPESRLVLMMESNKNKTGFSWGHTLGFMWLNGKLLMFISIIVLFPLTTAHRFKTEVQLVRTEYNMYAALVCRVRLVLQLEVFWGWHGLTHPERERERAVSRVRRQTKCNNWSGKSTHFLKSLQWPKNHPRFYSSPLEAVISWVTLDLLCSAFGACGWLILYSLHTHVCVRAKQSSFLLASLWTQLMLLRCICDSLTHQLWL